MGYVEAIINQPTRQIRPRMRAKVVSRSRTLQTSYHELFTEIGLRGTVTENMTTLFRDFDIVQVLARGG